MFNVFKKKKAPPPGGTGFLPQMLRERGRPFLKKGECKQKYEDEMTGEKFVKDVPYFMCTDRGVEGLGDGIQLYWVEAEFDENAGDVVLSMLNMRKRRELYRKYGDHNARVRVVQLPEIAFPMQYEEQLLDGYPVRFQVTEAEFERLLR